MGSDSVDVREFSLCDTVTEMTVKNETVWLRVKREDSQSSRDARAGLREAGEVNVTERSEERRSLLRCIAAGREDRLRCHLYH